MNKIRVGVLGATGMVGQHYLQLLSDHPWFDVVFLASSSRSAGQRYGDAVSGRWWQKRPPPDETANLIVQSIDAIDLAQQSCSLVFSAVSAQVSAEYEERYAAAGLAVVSNSSHHRSSPDVPMVIPEINADHLHLIPLQQRNRGWSRGFIVTKPNCSLQSYLIPLCPLHQRYRMTELIVTTLQAVSGAGYPGPAAAVMIDTVIPYIEGEEGKSEREPLKVLGTVRDAGIDPAAGIRIAAHCNRVPVTDGHLACVSVRFEQKPSAEDVIHAWRYFRGVPQQLALPSAPLPPIEYLEEQDRPQSRLDRMTGGGMTVTVGRLRECPVLDLRFVSLSHNVVRGAAGGAILIAELLVKNNLVSQP